MRHLQGDNLSMLTKMLPDQISKFWDVISYAIEQSLPPTVAESPDKMNRILASLLSDKIQCWASYEKIGDNRRFEGILLTQLLYDEASDTRSLLLYCAYGYDKVSNESWQSGFKTIYTWALSKGCKSIVSYTDIPYLIDLAKKFGGEAKYTFVRFSLSSFKNLTED